MEKDFTNLKPWLLAKLEAKALSVEELAQQANITRTAIYNYITDVNRPSEETMAAICRVLEVPLEEGLAQYTPKPVGRPKGTSGGGLMSLSVRSRE